MSSGCTRKAAENSSLVLHNSLHEVKIKPHLEAEPLFHLLIFYMVNRVENHLLFCIQSCTMGLSTCDDLHQIQCCFQRLPYVFSLFDAGNIPSAAQVEAARRKRHLARTEADYLPLDVSNSPQVPQRRGSSDLESEDESETKNLDFAPKMRTLRQRMTEDMGEFVVFLPEALFQSLEPCGTCPVRSEALLLRLLEKGWTVGTWGLYGSLTWFRSHLWWYRILGEMFTKFFLALLTAEKWPCKRHIYCE